MGLEKVYMYVLRYVSEVEHVQIYFTNWKQHDALIHQVPPGLCHFFMLMSAFL